MEYTNILAYFQIDLILYKNTQEYISSSPGVLALCILQHVLYLCMFT